ncbi:hypothetical protein HYDPIDRAFT_174627 [Hydnomerulius pinastri MD-312]|nr:hypothetical protein HYDPIDRAFT_174627 [Hydnomerulius pinastri MD-312]
MARATRISKGGSPKAPSLSKKFRPPGKGKAPAIDDVYEYAPSKVRRGKIALDLDRHETEGRRFGSDDEVDLGGMGQESMGRLRARLLGENQDDEQVDSEDDEEIESDDAFEESDKDEFAGSNFTRKGLKSGAPARTKSSKAKQRKLQDVDLNEDSDASAPGSNSQSGSEDENGDEEMEDGSAADFFDVLDVFDGKADAEDDEGAHREPPLKAGKTSEAVHRIPDEEEEEWKGAGSASDDEESEDEDEDEDEVDDEDDLHISVSDSEDASPEALAELESFISKLDPADNKKRKPDDAPATDERSKKRRILTERTEAGEESEFGVRGSSTLKLDDLLAPLASSSTALAALKKSTKPLTSSSAKTKTLAAPLPQRAQERLDREAAYEQTKEEVDKWSATMKRIKEAEHLSFPLQAEKPGRVSNLELAAKFMPSNELESAVDKLLKSAQLRDEDIANTESLKMAHLSVEEVAARRAELRMMRELAFRADRKAKRVAKIKSKAYRRIRKKQRERLDGAEEDDVEDEGERLKAEVQRARERATLRHKNTGKWAKAMKGREGLDQDQRQAIGEMLERGEKLRRRIRGEESGDESVENSESEDEELDEEAIKRGAFEELVALRAQGDTDTADLKSKSVFNMKFMRDAATRQSREADAQADDLAREMGFGLDAGKDSDADDIAEDTPATDAAMVHRTGGRISFHPGASAATAIIPRPLGSLASDTSSVTLQSTDLIQEMHRAELTPTPSLPTPTIAPAVNPWLVPSTSSGPSRKKNEARVHKDANTSSKSSNKLKKQAAKWEEEKQRARDDAVLEIDTAKVLTIPEPSAPSIFAKGKGRAKEGASNTKASTVRDDESDAHSELEEQERAVERKAQAKAGKGVQAFQQRDLVALAFAGDNVVQAFEESKRQEMEADAPREVDTTLAGWGSWGGAGTKKHPPKPHLIKKVAGVDPSSRADYKKAHVIISEKRDKKAAKYLVKDLPYPYTSHAQFARSMDTPLGTEWNTRVGFQRGTLPRVVKKMGTVIDPLEKL